MSRIPYLSGELSPWPRIYLDEVRPNATAVDQQTALLGSYRSSNQLSSDTPSFTKPRGRAGSYAGPVLAKSQIRGRSTSFGSTQDYRGVYGSDSVQRLNRNFSDRRVQELLKLRKQKLREAERKGDEVEIFRLKNLNVFDDIERLETENDEPKEADLGFTFQIDVLDSTFAPRPKSVSQGHTTTLCWHLKLQYAQGLPVPEEFAQCSIHPTPSPRGSSSSGFTLQPSSPSSFGSRSRDSLCHTKVSSIDSSTLRDSSEPSSPSTCSSSTAIASEPSSTTRSPSIVPNPNEEDPFLYIAKYIKRHAKGSRQFREAKQSGSQTSSAHTKRSIHIQCTCTNHNCRTYLSGPPSKHCRFCKVPRVQPEIAAAVDRIRELKTSVLAQADISPPAEERSEADEFCKFEALQEDIKLVEMYNAETEKRCRVGVWWEGWLIVEGLKTQGIVGSRPFVYERGESIA